MTKALSHVPTMKRKAFLFVYLLCTGVVVAAPSEQQLAQWLKKFPAADTDKDGRLTLEEAKAFVKKRRDQQGGQGSGVQKGVPQDFKVDPGWDSNRFPDHAVCYRSPEEIKAICASTQKGNPVVSYPKPTDGSLRIVGTGHSFMAPGYKTLPVICRAAGFSQPLHTHTGGGITGSARFKWEEENGIFQFDRKPKPKLLASIANAEWDVMMWGPYYKDRPAYYSCWIDFCLKFNPHMKFYLSDSWPQLNQLDAFPKSETLLTAETFTRLGEVKRALYAKLIGALDQQYPNKVFILPTCDAMVLAVQHYHRGELPGVEGVNTAVGKKVRSLWRDKLGHLGPGFDRLEGYVFYATIYGRSPERIEGDIPFPGSREYPNRELDRVFRRIAWQAVTGNPLSGVKDENGDGVGDGPGT